MFYFNNFPDVQYNLLGNRNITAKNITKRYKIKENVLSNVYVLYDYDVKEGERADVIAEKYYGDATLDWLIYLTNQIIDPHFDWHLTYKEFNEFIKKKYGSIEYAQTNIHSYYQITQPKFRNVDGSFAQERTVRVDNTAFINIPINERYSKTYFDYELGLNEEKMKIRIIDKSFVPQILQEINKIYD